MMMMMMMMMMITMMMMYVDNVIRPYVIENVNNTSTRLWKITLILSRLRSCPPNPPLFIPGRKEGWEEKKKKREGESRVEKRRKEVGGTLAYFLSKHVHLRFWLPMAFRLLLLLASIENRLDFGIKENRDRPRSRWLEFKVGMWKRLTASVLEGGIATSICTTKWKRKRKRKRWKRH